MARCCFTNACGVNESKAVIQLRQVNGNFVRIAVVRRSLLNVCSAARSEISLRLRQRRLLVNARVGKGGDLLKR